MTQHISTEPRRVHPKPKDKGTAHAVVHHERRHKTTEGKAGYIGAGCTITNITYQTNAVAGNYYPGIVTDGNGLRAYNASGVITMQINAADGSVSVFGSGVITGGTIQTSASNPRVIMDGSGLRAYNSAGTQTLNLSGADGSLTINNTGVLTGATIQTSATNPRVILDSSGLRAFDSSGTQQVTISNLGTFSLGGTSSSITAATSGVTISSSASTATGARVVVDATGIKGYNASSTQMFLLDATTGLIQATGVLSAQAGSSLPAGTITGRLPGSANRYSNSTFQNGAAVFDSTGWTFTNGTASDGGTTVPPVYGGLTCKVTCSAAGDVSVQSSTVTDPYKRVLPNLSYGFSHFVYPSTAARQSRIDVKWYNISGTLLSTTTGSTQTTTLSAWNRITQVATAPANAAYALGVHYVGLSAAVSDIFYVDAFQMEAGDVVSAWAPRPDEILYQQISANNINVSQLSAISANLGSIVAGNITGVIITGSTLQTSSSDPRTALDSTGFWAGSATSKAVTIDHVNGIRMTGGLSFPNTITWHNTDVGGPLVSQIYSQQFDSSRANEIIMQSYSPSNTGSNPNYVGVTSSNYNDQQSSAYASVLNASQSQSWSVTIVRGDGASSFVQMAEGHSISKYRALGTWSRGFSGSAAALGAGSGSNRFVNAVSYDPAGNFNSGYWFPGTSGDAIASISVSFGSSATTVMHAELWDGTSNTKVEQGPYIASPIVIGNSSVHATVPFQCTAGHGYYWRIVCDAISSGTVSTNTNWEYEAFKQVA